MTFIECIFSSLLALVSLFFCASQLCFHSLIIGVTHRVQRHALVSVSMARIECDLSCLSNDLILSVCFFLSPLIRCCDCKMLMTMTKNISWCCNRNSNALTVAWSFETEKKWKKKNVQHFYLFLFFSISILCLSFAPFMPFLLVSFHSLTVNELISDLTKFEGAPKRRRRNKNIINGT